MVPTLIAAKGVRAVTYLPEALSYSAQTERTIRLDLESGEMDPEGAALALMDLYGWLCRDARDQVEDWQSGRVK